MSTPEHSSLLCAVSTPASIPPMSSALAHPRRRSRNGCFDCRRAKVKCDEIRPSCGTCARRRHICQGYAKPPPPGHRAPQSRPSPLAPQSPPASDVSYPAAYTPSASAKSPSTETSESSGPLTPQLIGGALDMLQTAESPSYADHQTRQLSCQPYNLDLESYCATIETYSPSPTLDTPSLLSLVPPDSVPSGDAPNLSLYFNRHPFELVIGREFVSEMNATILLVLQRDPRAVADVLSAIGYSYLVDESAGSSALVLNRRARILANLRSMRSSGWYFEAALTLLLGLCAMELVSRSTPPHQAIIPAVHANVGSIISHHIATGGFISSVARYLLRALARQDMIVSLVSLRGTRVPTRVWLEDGSAQKPDRFLGYTATLMPLLEELCALAEDMRDRILPRTATDFGLGNCSTGKAGCGVSSPGDIIVDPDSVYPMAGFPDFWSSSGALSSTSISTPELTLRADILRQRLLAWRAPITETLSFHVTRKFRAQAAAYRTGALLYLHRLFHPPLQSASLCLATPPTTTVSHPIGGRIGAVSLCLAPSEADAEALNLAHEILLYTSGLPPEETKLLLWPVFLAACELNSTEDRIAVLHVFEGIGAQRRTVTVARTRRFVESRLWRARDEGREWNWMVLAQQYPGECLPI